MRIKLLIGGEVAFEQEDGRLGPQAVASLFCSMNDDQQAQFFEFVAREFDGFGPGRGIMQRDRIGDRMVGCRCVTDAGREWVEGLHAAIEYAERHGPMHKAEGEA